MRTSDELGALTVAFNAMIRRIRDTLKAQDQLLLNVSHELRSPITRMKLALEFIPASDKKRQIAADLAEMESMISELLEMERLRNSNGRLELKPENLSRLVRDVARAYHDRPPGVIISALQRMM